jgi:hypothetical protein
MPTTLERRFIAFLKSLPDSECLDSQAFCFPSGTRKADFLLHRRRVIAEIKTITNDPQLKIDRRLDQHLEQTGVVVFGTVQSSQLFEDKDEGAKFHQKILRDITRNTEEMCRSANEQIEETSQHLDIDASGLLIILNESIAPLDPGVVAYRVCEYLNKKPRRIDYCLLVFESHQVVGGNGHGSQNQMLVICACRTAHRFADDYIDQLMQRWAEHNGSEYIRRNTYDPTAINYRPKQY